MLHPVHLAIVKIKFLLFYFHFISFIKCHTFSPIFTVELDSLHRGTLTILILIFTHRASHELSLEPLNFTLSSSSPSNFTDLHPQHCSNFTVVDPLNFTITYLEHRSKFADPTSQLLSHIELFADPYHTDWIHPLHNNFRQIDPFTCFISQINWIQNRLTTASLSPFSRN